MSEPLKNTVNVIDDKSFVIDVDFPWPEEAKNVTHTVVSKPDGSTENLYVWALPGARCGLKEVRLVWNMEVCKASVDIGKKPTTVAVTIEDNKIAKVNNNMGGIIQCSRNYSNYGLDKESLGVICYMVDCGGLKKIEKIDVDEWDRDTIQQALDLVSKGISNRVQYMWLVIRDDFTAEDIVMAAPLLGVTESRMILTATLTSDQWQEVADKFQGVTDGFVLKDAVVDSASGVCVASICSKVRLAILETVTFEDIQAFAASFEEALGQEGTNCQEVDFEFEEGNVEGYKDTKEEIARLAAKLGWKANLCPYGDDHKIWIEK